MSKKKIFIELVAGNEDDPEVLRIERDIERIESADLGSVLYRVADRPEKVEALERRVRRARVAFYAHAATFLGIAALGTVAMLPIAFVHGTGAPLPAIGVAMLGWLTGLSVHGVSALVAGPRALRVHRQLWDRRQELEPQVTEDGASLLREIQENVQAARQRLASLDRPRIDLEATLEVAEREAARLAQALAAVDEALARPTTRRATTDRLQSLRGERNRIATLLERLRVTTANVEVDAILMANQPAAQAYTAEGLETEAELLRAAVEAARRAEASVLGEQHGREPARRRDR